MKQPTRKETRTYADRKEDLKRAVIRRRRKLKVMAVEYTGGKCCLCGYDRCVWALELHHVNPADKDFSISRKGHTRSWDRLREELDKCVLVCANCHRELEAGFVRLPVGK